ncbi:hypothetical protein NO932_14130 [Pelagibacterium sp. 26DY04]|uniref:hypothetical protein n=1 Tax=Pelagibacterium sp. 26DY04 TaxID=2967130 RepID=UPI0028158377|nr:hypothetical protein [Pelagibacterium sp. 26DY04]WMT86052.1 hypothetical protein NO932_14130 [Pelagibacterium sp. 26DY04]
MMTTPRLVSLTALAASLFIVILTITQANGLTGAPERGVTSLACIEAGQAGCEAAGMTTQASLLR